MFWGEVKGQIRPEVERMCMRANFFLAGILPGLVACWGLFCPGGVWDPAPSAGVSPGTAYAIPDVRAMVWGSFPIMSQKRARGGVDTDIRGQSIMVPQVVDLSRSFPGTDLDSQTTGAQSPFPLKSFQPIPCKEELWKKNNLLKTR